MMTFTNNANLVARLGEENIDERASADVEMNGVWFNKKASKQEWKNGDLVYTIEVKNDGDPEATPPNPDLTEITITDVIDPAIAKLVVESVTFDPEGSGTFGAYDPVEGTFDMTLSDITVGDTVTITFRVERVL